MGFGIFDTDLCLCDVHKVLDSCLENRCHLEGSYTGQIVVRELYRWYIFPSFVFTVTQESHGDWLPHDAHNTMAPCGWLKMLARDP